MQNQIYLALWLIGVPLAYFFGSDTHPNTVHAVWPLLIAAGATLASAAIGASAKGASDAQARAAQAAALAEWMKLNVPDPEQQKIVLQQLKSAGKLSPELEQTFQQQASLMGGIQTDPRLKEAQMNALSQLQQVGSSGGMMLEDKAALNEISSESANQARGAEQAIQQNMQARGMGGSGMEMAARLSSQQAAATRNANQSMTVAGMAQKRALDAMMQSGQLGGQIREQAFGEDSRKAEAQDAINRYNTANSQDVLQRNTATRNRVNESNLNNDQRIADTNAGLANQQEIHNKGLGQQQFENEAQKTAGMTGQYNTNANAASKSGQESAAMWSGIGQGIGQIGSAYATQDDDDKKKK